MGELQHPQESSDRQIIAQIIGESPTPVSLAEVARLIIRYQNFPGARDIQQDLEKILQQWDLTTETLFTQTRQLYSDGKLGNERLAIQETQDWS